MVQHPIVDFIITCDGDDALLDELSNFIEVKTCHLLQLTGTSFPTNASFIVSSKKHIFNQIPQNAAR